MLRVLTNDYTTESFRAAVVNVTELEVTSREVPVVAQDVVLFSTRSMRCVPCCAPPAAHQRARLRCWCQERPPGPQLLRGALLVGARARWLFEDVRNTLKRYGQTSKMPISVNLFLCPRI